MPKYLQFIDAGDDAATYPVDRLLAMTCATDATLLLQFQSSIGGSTGTEHDTVTLTIVADKEKEVMQSICDAINDVDNYVVVADDVKSIYVDSNITACAIALDT